jgi:hypothetical protein
MRAVPGCGVIGSTPFARSGARPQPACVPGPPIAADVPWRHSERPHAGHTQDDRHRTTGTRKAAMGCAVQWLRRLLSVRALSGGHGFVGPASGRLRGAALGRGTGPLPLRCLGAARPGAAPGAPCTTAAVGRGNGADSRHPCAARYWGWHRLRLRSAGGAARWWRRGLIDPFFAPFAVRRMGAVPFDTAPSGRNGGSPMPAVRAPQSASRMWAFVPAPKKTRWSTGRLCP